METGGDDEHLRHTQNQWTEVHREKQRDRQTQTQRKEDDRQWLRCPVMRRYVTQPCHRPPTPRPAVCKDAVFLPMPRRLTELARAATADCVSRPSLLLVAHSHEETAAPRITAGVHCRPPALQVVHQGLSFCAQCTEASLGQSPFFSLQ